MNTIKMMKETNTEIKKKNKKVLQNVFEQMLQISTGQLNELYAAQIFVRCQAADEKQQGGT